jgi:hypothetical protein
MVLFWKQPQSGNWIEVRRVSADEAEGTLSNFRRGHPMYEYKIDKAAA